MKVARYVGDGEIAIVDENRPHCPPGGLLVRTEACGLCSGELMSWYMDGKVPHVLGHEVCGKVIESESTAFPVGCRVFPHHHAPCMNCLYCLSNRYVHCEQWKRTRLSPGGMADYFAVGPLNLTDTHLVDDLRPSDAALVEALGCVVKSIRMSRVESMCDKIAVIGLGSMGLLHLLALPETTVGYDVNDKRIGWARQIGLRAEHVSQATHARYIFVCPGSQAAFDKALQIAEPEATILMFAPLAPGETLKVPQAAYFSDVTVVNSYSSGPSDITTALKLIREGTIKSEYVCSDFIELSSLPEFYKRMKAGEILKPMVEWR